MFAVVSSARATSSLAELTSFMSSFVPPSTPLYLRDPYAFLLTTAPFIMSGDSVRNSCVTTAK